MTNNQAQIIQEILKERQRQDEKFGVGRTYAKVGEYIAHWRGLNGPMSFDVAQTLGHYTMVSVLSEEAGEVGRACLESNLEDMRVELVQVCAVAMAMIEMLDMDNAKSASKSMPRIK